MSGHLVYMYAWSLAVHCCGGETNYALRRPAYQPSVAHGGLASRAVDGNASPYYKMGTCTHTLIEDNAWWAVDLQRPRLVTAFEITNRASEGTGEGQRLFDFAVEVGYHNSSVGDNEVCHFYNGTMASGATEYLHCGRPLFGRFVFVKKTRPHTDRESDVLTICEFGVYGQEFIPRSAYGRPVQVGLAYKGEYTFSVGTTRDAGVCMFACQSHLECISFIVTAMPTGGYLCEINDSEDTALQTTSEGEQCYMFEPIEYILSRSGR